jgi:hypothetical protein
VEGAEISVWFTTIDEADCHVVGTSEDGDAARAWVQRVNEIYAKRGKVVSKTSVSAVELGDVGIVMRDIVSTRQNIVLPGDYIYSADPHPPHVKSARFSYSGGAFRKTGLPAWQDYYVKCCMDQIIEKTGCKGPYKISIGNAPPHEYPWISDRVKYPSKESKSRITLPLEMMFDRDQRHDMIGVNKFAVVRHFALVYIRHQPVQGALALKSQELVATSFDGWISHFGKTTVRREKLKICTPTGQSVHYSLKDAVFQNRIEILQHHTKGSPDELRRWLAEHYRLGIIACDIGVAHQIIHDLRRNDDPIVHTVDYALVPYDEPVGVGFCYRVDDSQWASVCGRALTECSKSDRGDIVESLSEFKEKAAKIGMEVQL